jgi:hypothetical protein
MTYWKCGECSSIEGEKKIIPQKIPRRLFRRLFHWLEKELNFKLAELPQLPELLKKILWKVEIKEINVNIVAICHHCGKLLCQQHRILIIDDAFSVDEEIIRTLLPTWYPQLIGLKANRKFRLLENKFLLFLAKYHPRYKRLKQKAYHCKNCWKKHHFLAKREID